MVTKINIPGSFSVCFVGGDKNRTLEQQKLLEPLLQKYQIEFWKRSDIFSGFYASFSQIINEAVNSTNEDFIFFVNPKVNPTPSQIEEMLFDLCCGFCWTSKIAFGLWGTTKELFRNIGLMDERFIGSEWEDNDFICRLKMFDKAIKWQYSLDLYPSEPSPINDLRGMSLTLFRQKWVEERGNLNLDKDLSETKKIQNIKPRDDIKNSWMNGEKSIFLDNNGPSSYYFKKIKTVEFENQTIRCDGVLSIESDKKKIKFEFLCDIPTEISIQLLNEKKELVTFGVLLKSNHWNENVIFENIGDYHELKIFHEGDKIYHNKNMKIPIDFRVYLGFRINNKKLKNFQETS